MGVDEIYIPLRFTEFTHQRNLFHTSRSKSVEMVSAKKFFLCPCNMDRVHLSDPSGWVDE